MKYITIYAITLQGILRKTSNIDGLLLDEKPTGAERFDVSKPQFEAIFDLPLVRYDEDDDSCVFTNMIEMDGVNFMFASSAHQGDSISALGPEDFDEEDWQDYFHLWGAYPGAGSVYVAVDGHENKVPHQSRRYAQAEYYESAGYNKTNKKVLQMITSQEGYDETNAPSPTCRTASIKKLNTGISH